MFVRVIANGTTTTLLTLDDNDEGPAYVRYAFSLAPFAGQSIELRFITKGDASQRDLVLRRRRGGEVSPDGYSTVAVTGTVWTMPSTRTCTKSR